MIKPSIKTRETEDIAHIFGFRTTKEFVRDAVREKVRRLKAVLFSRTSGKVRRGMERAGFTEEEILRDFEQARRS